MIAGAVAFLVGRGLTSLVANLIVWGLVATMVAGAGLYVHHQWDVHVLEPARVEGDERTLKKLKPQIAGLEKRIGELLDNVRTTTKERDDARKGLQDALSANATLLDSIEGSGGLRDQIKQSKESVRRWAAVVAQLKASNAALLKRLDDAVTAANSAVERARAIAIEKPAASFADACRQADQILIDLARRMHEPA